MTQNKVSLWEFASQGSVCMGLTERGENVKRICVEVRNAGLQETAQNEK